MYHFNKGKVAYIDVDDTLILWDWHKYPHKEEERVAIYDHGGRYMEFLPHFKNIEFVKNLKFQGYGIVVWSAAGSEWAEKAVKALKLEDYVDVVLSKPELAVDDLIQPDRIIKSVLWIDPLTGEYLRNK